MYEGNRKGHLPFLHLMRERIGDALFVLLLRLYLSAVFDSFVVHVKTVLAGYEELGRPYLGLYGDNLRLGRVFHFFL